MKTIQETGDCIAVGFGEWATVRSVRGSNGNRQWRMEYDNATCEPVTIGVAAAATVVDAAMRLIEWRKVVMFVRTGAFECRLLVDHDRRYASTRRERAGNRSRFNVAITR